MSVAWTSQLFFLFCLFGSFAESKLWVTELNILDDLTLDTPYWLASLRSMRVENCLLVFSFLATSWGRQWWVATKYRLSLQSLIWSSCKCFSVEARSARLRVPYGLWWRSWPCERDLHVHMHCWDQHSSPSCTYILWDYEQVEGYSWYLVVCLIVRSSNPWAVVASVLSWNRPCSCVGAMGEKCEKRSTLYYTVKKCYIRVV